MLPPEQSRSRNYVYLWAYRLIGTERRLLPALQEASFPITGTSSNSALTWLMSFKNLQGRGPAGSGASKNTTSRPRDVEVGSTTTMMQQTGGETSSL